LQQLLFILLLLSTTGYAQTTDSVPMQLVKEYKCNATDFSVDAMGNLYLVTKNNQLKKIKENGDSIAVYNLSKRYGKLHYIDASYPMKLLLYFKDFSTIITADRLLQVTNTIDLRKDNIYQVQALTSSYDGQFWFYDEQEAKLKKINNQGKITQQTVDLRQVLQQLPTPQKIIENDNLLYVCDSLMGVYVFDYYGALKNSFPLKNYTNLFIYNQIIYAVQNNCIVKYTIATKNIQLLQLPKMPIILKTVIAAGNIYFLHKNGILVYKN
jgi:hypothetical protein